MNSREAPDRFTTRSHWFVSLISYLLIAVVTFRRVNELDGMDSISLALLVILLFTILYISEPRLSRRFSTHPWIYFLVQTALIQILGIIQDYIDAWAILYIVLGFQVVLRCSKKAALMWGGLFLTSIMVSFFIEFGLISGFGRGMAYFVIGVFLISFDIQYAQHEDALAESQVLLAELREAHQKLQDYAAQVDKLAAAQEHNRMVKELYDSIGQKIFAIQLAAEATRLMLEKDPQRAAKQIEDLQAQTQSTLSQMRQLIGQWRPG